MPIIYDDGVVISQIFCGTDNNNAYLVICPTTKEAIVVDAPEGVGALLSEDEEVRVKSIIITHKHKDHTEGIDEILQLMGVPVFGHQDDASDIPGSPILTIKDTDTIKVGMLDITVIHTPGHTPGSICLLVGRYLFTGDTLYFQGPGESQGVDATEQLLKSVTERLYILPDDTILLPGHGPQGILGGAKELYRGFVKQYPDLLPRIPGELQ